MMLAGGVDAPLSPQPSRPILCSAHSHRCGTTPQNELASLLRRPKRFVLAEGSWMFVVEDYDHAWSAVRACMPNLPVWLNLRRLHRSALEKMVKEPARAITLVSKTQRVPEQVDYVICTVLLPNTQRPSGTARHAALGARAGKFQCRR